MGLLRHHDLGENIDGRSVILLGNAKGSEAGLDQSISGPLGEHVLLIAFLEVVLEVSAFHDRAKAFQ